MPTKLCRDRIMEVLESVSEPLSTAEIADRLPENSVSSVSGVSHTLRIMWLANNVSRSGHRNRRLWQIRQALPPLEIAVYEEDSEADRKACATLDKAIASARRDWEQRP